MWHTLEQCHIHNWITHIVYMESRLYHKLFRRLTAWPPGYFELNGHPYQQIAARGELAPANFQPCSYSDIENMNNDPLKKYKWHHQREHLHTLIQSPPRYLPLEPSPEDPQILFCHHLFFHPFCLQSLCPVLCCHSPVLWYKMAPNHETWKKSHKLNYMIL